MSPLFSTGKRSMHERKTCFAITVLLLFAAAAMAVAAEQAQIALPSSVAATPAAGTGAKLDFESPPPGEKSPITGKLSGVDKPNDYKLLILVSNDRKRWWDKTHILKTIPVANDGSFNIETWVSDPHDLTVSYIGVWAVPASFDTTGKSYTVEGAPIPENVTEIAVASQIKGRKGVPQIDFVPPPLNTSNAITGKVTGIDTPTDYKVVLLLSRDQKIWWDKTHNVHGVTIQPDGTFTVKGWANVPRTLTTPYVGVWLVPTSFDLSGSNFQVEGAAVPEKLTKAAVAMKIKSREPSAQVKPDASAPELSNPETTAKTVPTTDADILGASIVAGAVVDFEAPVLGSDAPITGKLGGVRNPADYQVLILVSADQQRWWDKTHNVHGAAIRSDGTFAIKSWVVDPHDLTVANVGIWIVPKSFDISWNAYQVEGRALPDKVKQAAIAAKIQRRKENAEINSTRAR
jgi:hypothetical protein